MKNNQEAKKNRNKKIQKIEEIIVTNNTRIVTEKEMIEVRKNREKFLRRIEAIL